MLAGNTLHALLRLHRGVENGKRGHSHAVGRREAEGRISRRTQKSFDSKLPCMRNYYQRLRFRCSANSPIALLSRPVLHYSAGSAALLVRPLAQRFERLKCSTQAQRRRRTERLVVVSNSG